MKALANPLLNRVILKKTFIVGQDERNLFMVLSEADFVLEHQEN